MRFLSVWAKYSPDMMKKHIKMSEKSFCGGLSLFWARKRSKWRNAVSCASEPKHLWKKPGCCGECQNGSRLPRKTFKDIFWRSLIISGFFLPQTDQKCTFYTIFSSKWPSGRYEASSNWIFAPRSILSPRMTSDPKDGLSKHKIYLISSFLGFILPKSDQKRTF